MALPKAVLRSHLIVSMIFFTGFMTLSGHAFAKADQIFLPIADVFKLPAAKKKLNPEIKITFVQPVAGTVLKENVVSNRRTSSTGDRGDFACLYGSEDPMNVSGCQEEISLKMCRWAMLSTLLGLQKAAMDAGANNIANVVSFYDSNTYSSATQYECRVGNHMVNVVMSASLVKAP